jgi:hypothetical protein
MRRLSVILPYYKRIGAFAEALAANSPCFIGRPDLDLEVVLVLDEPTEEEEVLRLVGSHAEIGWRVLINRRDHPWRNPSRAINVGLRHARGEMVLIMSPESLMVTDVPDILSRRVAEADGCFALGRICFTPRQAIIEKGLGRAYEEGEPKRFYGSMCAPLAALTRIRGYDEANGAWGGDDDNIRLRLIMSGLSMKYVPWARALHPLEAGELVPRLKGLGRDQRELQAAMRPQGTVANQPDWGRDFDEIIYESAARPFGPSVAD